MNKKLPVLVPVVLLLAACAPMSIYFKPEVAVSRMESDTLTCATRALSQAPVANQVRQRPPIYYPGRQVCNGIGQCVYYPGYWIDGGYYTVDVNLPIRTQIEDSCMAKKGYQPVSLSRCTSVVSKSVTPGASITLPRSITKASCVIPYKDGSYQVVTPGGVETD